MTKRHGHDWSSTASAWTLPQRPRDKRERLRLRTGFGKTGQPFVVGSHHRSNGESRGRLYLGINDIDQDNNQGEFLATITAS